MKRTVIKIDEQTCNGCGNCVSGCHEGALQLVNGKAVMISDLYCDGLGACIGECPVGAISFEEREAEPYDEKAVMERLVPKGADVVIAHLKHLKDHGEDKWFNEGLEYLKKHGTEFDISSLTSAGSRSVQQCSSPKQNPEPEKPLNEKLACGCPGSMARNIDRKQAQVFDIPSSYHSSELSHFPVQLALVNPSAAFFEGSDLLLAADCTAFAFGGFHNRLLKGKTLAVACPKLDTNLQIYVDKLAEMIDHAKINTLTVAIMEVPCCRGLFQLAEQARNQATRKIPLKVIIVSVSGEIVNEEWV